MEPNPSKEITCYKYRKYIYLFCLETVKSMQNTPLPIFARWIIHQIRIQNCSLGSIFNRVNIQRVGVIKIRKKMYLQSCWKMTPGIFSTTLDLYFQRRKSTRGSIFNVEKWTPGQFSTRFKILRYTGYPMFKIQFSVISHIKPKSWMSANSPRQSLLYIYRCLVISRHYIIM
jgi:hypothetical protein